MSSTIVAMLRHFLGLGFTHTNIKTKLFKRRPRLCRYGRRSSHKQEAVDEAALLVRVGLAQSISRARRSSHDTLCVGVGCMDSESLSLSLGFFGETFRFDEAPSGFSAAS